MEKKYLDLFKEIGFYQLLKETENGDSSIGIVNKYHREPTVLDHVIAVSKYVEKHYKNHKDYEVLYLGALLHDIGKPFVRQVLAEKQKVAFYGHEMAGIPKVLEFFDFLETKDIFLTKDKKDKIISIVAFHDIYKYDAKTNMGRFDKETYDLLYDFTKADNGGRITDSPHITIKEEYVS